MSDCWLRVKRDVLLTQLTVDEARATDTPHCLFYFYDLDEAVENGAFLVTTAHCACKYWSCRDCYKTWCIKGGNEWRNGLGDWHPCLVCEKPGVPRDEDFRLHADYIGAVAAKEIKDDFFEVREGAPRFDRETFFVNPIEITTNAPPHIAAMEAWINNDVDYKVRWKRFLDKLTDVATKNKARRSIDVNKDVLSLARKTLKAHRKAAVLKPDTFAEELYAAQQYVGDRIMLRRQEHLRSTTTKSKKRKHQETEQAHTNDEGVPSHEADGHRVREIQGHEKDENGVTVFHLWWLGYSNSTKSEKTLQPIDTLIDAERDQCPDLFTGYLLSVREKTPEDPILVEFADWLEHHPVRELVEVE